LGLAALDERARMLDGTLDIATQPGKGTCIALVIPVRSCPAVPRSESLIKAS
jgi:hypothetical protein